MNQKKKKLSRAFQKRLLVVVVIAFLVTTAFLWITQTELSKENAFNLMLLNIQDIRQEIVDASDKNLLEVAYELAEDLDRPGNVPGEATLIYMAAKYELAEVSVIDENGIIIVSTNREFVGYDMSSGEQSAEFLVLLDGETGFVQSYQPISYDDQISRKYAGAVLERGGFVQIGYNAAQFQRDIASHVQGVTRNRHIGEGGWMIIADENWTIVSDRNGNEGKQFDVTGFTIDTAAVTMGKPFVAEVYGESCYCIYMMSEGYYVVAAMPQSEAVLSRNVSVSITTAMEVIVFAVLFVLIYILVKRLVVDNIQKINGSLSEITDGNLEVLVDVRSHEEFDSLSNDINATVDTLKRYIADAEARIDAELELAKAIQHSALPSVFPPFPHRKDFDIWASMYTAKEVGGDFYDFYLINEDILAFLVADVSGKGIPAAMFMMTAKTLLKSYAEAGMEVNDVFTYANESLCENNDAGMFVTAWLGMLNTKTGRVSFANAGHNPPLVKHADGSYTYLKSRPGFVLAGMEGIRYRKNELQLNPGDTIYLYTDGVTEATNANNELYGEARLLDILNQASDADTEMICQLVKEDVDAFVGDAPQFDDITMLCLKYGKADGVMKKITVDAVIENMDAVTGFIEEQLENMECPMKMQMQINIAVDEVFSNIANYAYGDVAGTATICVEQGLEPRSVILTFIDSGKPYNPLSAEDPDISLSAEDRQIGGLGIFMVKKIMDEVYYEYKNGQNVLKVKKYL